MEIEDAIRVNSLCVNPDDDIKKGALMDMGSKYGLQIDVDYRDMEQLCGLLKKKMSTAVNYLHTLCTTEKGPISADASKELVRLGDLAGLEKGIDYTDYEGLCRALHMYIGVLPLQDIPLDVISEIMSFLPNSTFNTLSTSNKFLLHVGRNENTRRKRLFRDKFKKDTCPTPIECGISFKRAILQGSERIIRYMVEFEMIDPSRFFDDDSRLPSESTLGYDMKSMIISGVPLLFLLRFPICFAFRNSVSLETLLQLHAVPKSITRRMLINCNTAINMKSFTVSEYGIQDYAQKFELLIKYVDPQIPPSEDVDPTDKNPLTFLREHVGLFAKDRYYLRMFEVMNLLIDRYDPLLPFRPANTYENSLSDTGEQIQIWSGRKTEYDIVLSKYNEENRMKRLFSDILKIYDDMAKKYGNQLYIPKRK